MSADHLTIRSDESIGRQEDIGRLIPPGNTSLEQILGGADKLPDDDGEVYCETTATVDAHAFSSPDGNDWPTLTCCLKPGHDGPHQDEMNLIGWTVLESPNWP